MLIDENGKLTKCESNFVPQNEEQSLMLVQAFLQGAVYAFCNINTTKEFRLKDLVGGKNYYWQKTPLFEIYKRYMNSENAVKDAGYKLGVILFEVLKQDKRTFHYRKQNDSTYKGFVYRWDGEDVLP